LGLKYAFAGSAAILAFSSALLAAPQLRLSQTAVGPLAVTQGQNGARQIVYASNVGDGALNLRLTTNVPWLAASTGPAAECSLRGLCTPVNIELRTNSLAAGMYTGTIAVSDPNATDAPQTIVVTVQIGTGVPEKVDVALAPGASTQIRFSTSNPVDVSVSVPSGQNWLAVAAEGAGSFAFGSTYPIAVNSSGLAEGDYTGQFATSKSTVAAENRTVPVALEVTSFSRLEAAASGAPVAFFGGVVNNATFEGDALAPGGIVAIFGDGFVPGQPAQAGSLPLPTELGGVRVLVNDKPAPVYFASPNQINFQIPYDTPAGDATVRVEKGGQRGNAVSMHIGRSVPRLLRLNIADYGIVVNGDGSFPIPPTTGLNSHPAKVGDTLVIYALGLGQTEPAVQSGVAAPSEPLGRARGNYRVSFGAPGPFGSAAADVTPLYVGLTPNFVGLYQINVTIPPDTPKGTAVPVALVSDQEGSSNRVNIAIE
jgi:uncharacterized protein (TIGR03437 family)